jgi:pyruvate dehydrogenase E2 component (dihydrolipoamide acetyltransferase)
MAVEMIMPKVDMDQETGTVVEWKKQNGDPVTQGEIILVIETDKVAIDVEAPETGILNGISAKPGDVIPIGTVIAYILEPGEELPAEAGLPQATEKAAAVEAAQDAPAPAGPVAATPVAQNMAAAHQIDLSGVIGTGRDGKVTKADVEALIAGTSASPALPEVGGKVYASPAARRIARERNIDLAQVAGTGPKGRVQGFDVESFTPAVAASLSQPAAISVEPEVIPLVGMRRTIAERMTASYQNIPHIRFTARIDMTRFMDARKAMNAYAAQRDEMKVSATALLVKLIATTLQKHPWLNSSLKEDEIWLHKEINIGVAVALEAGLIVPVVRNADQKAVQQLAQEIGDLAVRAREGKLVSSEVKGGTFTISNLGPFGVEQFDAIINPGEAAILAIGDIHPEAVPQEDGQIASRPIMMITLSADHRIVDGAVAARFIADLKAVLENPVLSSY